MSNLDSFTPEAATEMVAALNAGYCNEMVVIDWIGLPKVFKVSDKYMTAMLESEQGSSGCSSTSSSSSSSQESCVEANIPLNVQIEITQWIETADLATLHEMREAINCAIYDREHGK